MNNCHICTEPQHCDCICNTCMSSRIRHKEAMMAQSILTFHRLNEDTIEVIDTGEVVARIEWNPDDKRFEFDAIDGDYVYFTEDLIAVVKFMDSAMAERGVQDEQG